jgi:hypothetical protein
MGQTRQAVKQCQSGEPPTRNGQKKSTAMSNSDIPERLLCRKRKLPQAVMHSPASGTQGEDEGMNAIRLALGRIRRIIA